MMMPLVSMAQNFNEDGGKYEVYCRVVDLGSERNILINNKHYKIVDKDGKLIGTKDVMEILNLLAKRGWKLVTSFSSGSSTNKYFIMKKEVKDDKEIDLGLVVKK
jgi:hypothetical protein